MHRKQLWLLAGGNGAGKSTFYRLFLSKRGIQFVNADLIAKELDPDYPETMSYQASHLASKIREDLLIDGVSFCFETVFSHHSKVDFVAKAKQTGYEVILVYIHLKHAKLNEARVSQRVIDGGHDVPVEKIHSRIPRTVQNIKKVLSLVDEARILDNSSSEHPFEQIARVRQGHCEFLRKDIPNWAKELLIDFE